MVILSIAIREFGESTVRKSSEFCQRNCILASKLVVFVVLWQYRRCHIDQSAAHFCVAQCIKRELHADRPRDERQGRHQDLGAGRHQCAECPARDPLPFKVANLAPGSHRFTAKATHNRGEVMTSAAIAIGGYNSLA
jgi:hypothetical protein